MRKSFAVLVVFVIVALVAWIVFWRAGAFRITGDESSTARWESSTAAPSEDAITVAPVEGSAREVVLAEASVAAPAPRFAPLVVQGRVLDDRRRPFGGADVTFVVRPGEELRAESGSDGAFRFEIERPLGESMRGSHVRAVSGDLFAAHKRVALPTPESRARAALFEGSAADTGIVDTGPLVLLPATRARVGIRAEGVPAAGATLTLTLELLTGAAASFTADARGEVLLPALPAGNFALRARLGERSAGAAIVLPEDRETRLELQPPRELRLHVVDAKSGAPVAGALLEFTELVNLPPSADPESSGARISGGAMTNRPLDELKTSSDAEGNARVLLFAHADLRVRVTANGYAAFPKRGWGGPALAKSESPLRLELEPERVRDVRWPIVAGELPVPAEGTLLSLRTEPGSRAHFEAEPELPAGRVADGNVVVDGLSGVNSLLARTPDGALTRLWVPRNDTPPPAVSFRAARTIEVLVRDAAGAPVSGARAVARNQGNNELGPWVATDSTGRAFLTGLYGALADVEVRGDENSSVHAGSVDLEHGDGRVEARLPASCVVRARILIDGQPALPAKYALWCDAGARVIEELPDLGELRVRSSGPKDSTALKYTLNALGFAPARAEVVPAAGVESVCVFALERAGRLVVEVRRGAEPRVEIGPQRWNDVTGSWPQFTSGSLRNPNGSSGTFVFDGLERGRYRVRENESGFLSNEVDLVPGVLAARVVLDLSASGWVTGRIAVPDARELDRARLVVEGIAAPIDPRGEIVIAGASMTGQRVAADGTFRVRVPGDRDVTLRAVHPWLVPARDHGAITLRSARDGVVLELEAGPHVRVPLVHGAGVNALRVAAFTSAVDGAPIAWFHAPVEDGVARFAGLAPGTWTLWLDPQQRELAPRTLERVDVGPGVCTLSGVSFGAGSSVRLRVAAGPGSAPPRVYAIAKRLAGPEFSREVNSRGEAEVVLPGFDRGRYSVSVSRIDVGAKRSTFEIELDGEQDAVLDVDPR